MAKKKSVASLDTSGSIVMGVSDVIRWGDVMKINGYDISVSKAVKLGLKHDLDIAKKLEVDLKSKTGLLLTFPMGMLMDQLQRGIGTGEKLLALVKA